MCEGFCVLQKCKQKPSGIRVERREEVKKKRWMKNRLNRFTVFFLYFPLERIMREICVPVFLSRTLDIIFFSSFSFFFLFFRLPDIELI